MTTVRTSFWRDPEFAEFLPYIKATAAWDKRHGKSPRFDLKSGTPFTVLSKALAFQGTCADCGAKIRPFRSRVSEAKRGPAQHNVYLAATCPLDVRIGCSRGKRASAAYQEIWSLIRAQEADGEQRRLF